MRSARHWAPWRSHCAVGAARRMRLRLETRAAAAAATRSRSARRSQLSGPLAGFGSFLKWGYQHAVDEVNAAGGIEVDGKKKKVELILLDDKTDPNTTSRTTRPASSPRTRSTRCSAPARPALVNAGALVADRNRVPLVTGCDPLGAFTSVKKWKYAWDLFFAEPELPPCRSRR